jgi:hypothetical protein
MVSSILAGTSLTNIKSLISSIVAGTINAVMSETFS